MRLRPYYPSRKEYMIKYIIHKASNYTNGIGDNRFILWFNWYFILKHTKSMKNLVNSEYTLDDLIERINND